MVFHVVFLVTNFRKHRVVFRGFHHSISRLFPCLDAYGKQSGFYRGFRLAFFSAEQMMQRDIPESLFFKSLIHHLNIVLHLYNSCIATNNRLEVYYDTPFFTYFLYLRMPRSPLPTHTHTQIRHPEKKETPCLESMVYLKITLSMPHAMTQVS